MNRARILKELNEARKFKEPNIILTNDKNDLLLWKAFILGPPGSPYQDGIFELKITLPTYYPLHPPKVFFKTKVFHPNVKFDTGEICLDILKDQWTPVWTLESICLAILDLMVNPNPDSPLNCDAGNLIRAGDKLAYNDMVKMFTLDYAISKAEFEKQNGYSTLLSQEKTKEN